MAATHPLPRERDAERRRIRDWLEALDDVVALEGRDAAERLLRHLQRRAAVAGVTLPFTLNTPYVNTIPPADEPRYPGDLELERRIEALVRWNAMAMVVRANRRSDGIGGHISTFASAATLFEVGFNHFFRGKGHPRGGDQIYFQGHASPGVYARAFLEGRLSETQIENFRRELQPGGGVASYPHPWLMPDFWEFPTVSMGTSPLMAVHQAHFNRYLEHRGLACDTGRVWVFLGDGEMDEPEATGALPLAGREGLDNLIFVLNCNLQRLDGFVRGNSRVIDELESLFLGAGWRVIKVLWGSDWDPLFEHDPDGLLVDRIERTCDGDWQKYAVEGGAYLREHLFGTDPALGALVDSFSDAELGALSRGGHDARKVYAAYHAATLEAERPTVILAHTIKGYGLGPSGEAHNVTHQMKKLSADALRYFRDRFDLPIPDDRVADAPLYRPPDDSPEIEYLRTRREALGGPVPRRTVRAEPISGPDPAVFARTLKGSGERPATTTMILVRLLADLIKDRQVGAHVVPIVPDEGRTFGLEALFPQIGIYSPVGQRYVPVDAGSLLSYKERREGQILEEGITEAGCVSSFIAAGTAHATHGVPALPFYFFYSMFGFQRAGDFLWAAGDIRARGFLVGATSGRTTLNGEGLQHEDGHSQLVALTHPTLRAWDPAFGYEIAVIVEDGIRRLWREGEDALYYVTVTNEAYRHPPMPEGVRDDILRGMYRLRPPGRAGDGPPARLLASGPIVQIALRAAERLEAEFGVPAEVWSVTSWKALYVDCLDAERQARLHPGRKGPTPWLRRCLGDDPGAVVAVSDWIKAVPGVLARWLPDSFVALGTDGFGRSDSREALRDFFEIDERWVTHAALETLARRDAFPRRKLKKAIEALGLDPDKPDPSRS